MSMVSRAIFSEFPENTHSTFRDCRVHFCTFFRQPFSKELYRRAGMSRLRDTTGRAMQFKPEADSTI